jgi:hypothetical protein
MVVAAEISSYELESIPDFCGKKLRVWVARRLKLASLWSCMEMMYRYLRSKSDVNDIL